MEKDPSIESPTFDRELALRKLDIDREQQKLDHERLMLDNRWFVRMFPILAAAVVSVAGIVVSIAQFYAANIASASADSTRNEERRRAAAESDRAWRLEVLKFVAANLDQVTSADSVKRNALRGAMFAALPDSLALAVFSRLEQAAPAPARSTWAVGRAAASLAVAEGVPGVNDAVGCGDSLWQRVYIPSRLLIKRDCITVTGVIVDATANTSQRQPDGVRHEPDGDAHGWLRVDPEFESLLNVSNLTEEGGNLVFEVVCHYYVTQPNARAACAGFKDHVAIPPLGSHVAMRGTLVQDRRGWHEIHPVSSISVQ